MNKIIIGLGSKARIGKDYAATQLSQYFDVERISFADALKADLAQLFQKHDIDFQAILNDPITKEIVRPLLVEYGQAMRAFDQDVWVNSALAGKEFTHDVTIITDVRFPNEVQAIKNIGGYYVEIISDVTPANQTEALYSSQMAELADMTIRNNFDGFFIRDLKEMIEGLQHNSILY